MLSSHFDESFTGRRAREFFFCGAIVLFGALLLPRGEEREEWIFWEEFADSERVMAYFTHWVTMW